jgi:CubicO group peptidase (beta-lactamase class C family)
MIWLAAFAAFLVVAWVIVDKPFRVATGFIVHTLCSEVFVSGLDPDHVFEEKLKPYFAIRWFGPILRRKVDMQRREVSATMAGMFGSRAMFRDGLGCLVVHGEEPAPAPPAASIAAIVAEARAAAPPAPKIAGPAPVEPADGKLRAALGRAFSESDRPPYRRTKAFIVAHQGRIVAERYAPGYGIDTPILGWSIAKSVIDALLGILVRDGRLALGQPVPVPAWQAPDDPRRAITVEQLLRMTSGLALRENYTGFDPSTQMLYLQRDMAGFAEKAALAAAPGSTWRYTAGNTLILSKIIRDITGGRPEDVLRFAWRELFAPLGMRHVTVEFDAAGTPVGSTYMLATARDWARLGMLYANDGMAGGRRILPAGWVRYSSTPTLGTDYGAGWWTNAGTNKEAAMRVRAGMPPDSFFASGALGQRVIVIPSEQLVVVILGAAHGRSEFDVEFLAPLVADVVAAVRTR